jgi:hypothetical protein
MQSTHGGLGAVDTTAGDRAAQPAGDEDVRLSLCDVDVNRLRSLRTAITAVLAATAFMAGFAPRADATVLGTVTVYGYVGGGGGGGGGLGGGGGANGSTSAPWEPYWAEETCTEEQVGAAPKFLTGCSHVVTLFDIPNNSFNPTPATCQSEPSTRLHHAGSDVAPRYSGLLASGIPPRIGSTLTVEYNDGSTEDYRLNAVPMSTEAEVFLTRIDGTLDCD